MENKIKRTLGLFDTTMMVSGSMIGSGIFIVSSEMSRTVASAGWLLVCWILTGVITIFAALSYGELAGMMPNVGGQYVYIKRAYNKFTAFLYGWTVFTVIQTGVIAAVAVAFAKYSSLVFPLMVSEKNPVTGVVSNIPFFGEDHILIKIGVFKISYAQILAVVMIAIQTWINTRGIQGGKFIQRIFTSAKLIALFGLIAIGLYYGWGSGTFKLNFSDTFSNVTQVNFTYDNDGNVSGTETQSLSGMLLWGAVGAALIGSLFSSDAWNNVTFIAAEIKDPQKNIPMGLFLGTCIVTVIYVLANVAYLCLLPLKGIYASDGVMNLGIQFAEKERVGAAAMMSVFGNSAQIMMAALIMISTFGCNNGLILAGSRLFQSMAQDGVFFKKAGILNNKSVPSNSLVIQGIWAGALCLTGSYGDLLGYSTFASLIFYMITIGGIFILRKKEPATERPYKAFGYPIVPALYILITFIICIDLLYFKPGPTFIGLGIVALGIPVYFISERLSTSGKK
ncbi:MAG: APC family permease [Bacteroidota bacterium]|jgi:APA family basic amino acid/polyamine antiporter